MRPWPALTLLTLPWLVFACGGGGDSISGSFTTDSFSGTTTDPGSSSGTPADSSSTGGASADGESSTSEPPADTSTSEPADSSGDSSSGDTGIDACDQVDEPDINGIDENEDGVDGVLCRAVFVNGSAGSDLNDGLMQDDAVATIGRGIEIAQTYNPPRMVLVAAGDYSETINVNSGVSLFGGYSPDDWSRDIASNVTEISASENRAIIAQNLDLAVEIDGFTINAQDYLVDGETSYGVWVRDTPEGLFTLDYCIVNAGTGGAGNNGEDAENGGDGGSGTNAINGAPGAGGTSECNATGGNGGSGQACPATGGTDGAAGGDPTTVGQAGPAGGSDCNSGLDTCGDDLGSADGTAGQLGHSGVNGDGSEAPNNGIGSFGGDGIWVVPVGDAAERGAHGSGGGGGGAGGYDFDGGVCFADTGNGIGGGGGGGGAGGCGGDGGESGQPGGGSFAIIVVNSSIAVTNVDINLASGGDGGRGGDGGDGGAPGSFGNGANGVDNGGEPGDGANGNGGGGGGGGGGGAGGCGGASVGIASVGNAEAAVNNVSFNDGAGGAPGVGGAGGLRANGLGQFADEGDDGCNGFRADEHEY